METTLQSTTDLRRKLLGKQFVPLSESEYKDRLSSCQTCPLLVKQTCGNPRQPFDLTRDESILGSGLPLAKRQTRVECACPLGRWSESSAIPGSRDRIGVFTSGFSTTSWSSQLVAKQIQKQFGMQVTVVGECTPCVCLQPETAPLYAFDLFPEASYVAYVSPEIFFFENSGFPDLKSLDKNGLYAYRLPSPYESYYSGIFIAHRDMWVLFELAKDQVGQTGLWWKYVCGEAAKTDRLFELNTPPIFFPFREKPPDAVPQAISLNGVRPDERERLLKRIHTSPSPWREVCAHFRWADRLKHSDPYPPGTKIAIDCNTAGIGDVIDVAHIVEALKSENPGVEVHVYTKSAKRSFVDLYGNFGPVEYADVKHELPPSPWHKLDETKFAKTRIENWAIYCGASTPKFAKPVLNDEALAYAEDFVRNLPSPRVIISPISTCPTRSWPMERYEALGLLLKKEGISVIMIDEPEGAKTLGMPFTRIYGQGAEREAAVIAQCQLLTGNDSGMAHLSASLEVPTLVLCGPTDGRKIFEWYKKAHWMDGPLPCAGCYFYGQNGWSEECQHGCLSILQIGVEDVFRRCIEILHA